MAVQTENSAKVNNTPTDGATTPTGKTVIVDSVIAKIAGIAAREVPGVVGLGGGAARIVGAIRGAVGQTDLTQGVKVEVGETEVAADVTIVVDYPLPLMKVGEDVRQAVASAITELVGMKVAEVVVTVTDVHIASDDDDDADADASTTATGVR